MASATESEARRAKLNRELATPADWELFRKKITEYNRNRDTSRHEIKLSGKRMMAIFMTYKGWQAALWRTI